MHHHVVVLTGAGVSADSGVRTFRDAGGLWEGHHVEDVATPEGWARDPALVWRFYQERRAQLRAVEPNAAHLALAAFERAATAAGHAFTLVTQNVDDLHDRAGSTVLHMHGELLRLRCEACDHVIVDRERVDPLRFLPCAACGHARLRPHIVWFGEVPFEMHAVKRRVQACDVFVTVGSSGVVYPAAGLVREVTYRQSQGENVRSVYVGIEAPANADAFNEVVIGKAGEVLPGLFAMV
jgi:NAD-dependent deacetylase